MNHGERDELDAERVGVWGGGVPLPTGKGFGSGSKFFKKILERKLASFCAFWELFSLQLNCLSYTHKLVSLDFGL